MPKPDKITIPTDLSIAHTVPESATPADLDAMIAQVTADARKLLQDDNATAEDVAKAEWLTGTRNALNGRKSEIQALEVEQAERVKAARDALGPEDGEGEGDDDNADDDKDAEDKDKRDGDEPDDGGTGGGGVGDLQTPAEPVLVASAGAARRRSAIRDAARQSGTNGAHLAIAEGKPREAYLTAAAEVSGFAAGSKISFEDVGVAASGRFGQLPNPMHGNGGRVVLPFAQVKLASDPSLVASARTGEKHTDVSAQVEWALSRDRLKRETGTDGSLTAAGGWCAPSETLYDLVDLTTEDGMIDVAGIVVTRGGVRYTLGPNYSAVFNGGQNFTRTEAQTQAGLAKPVVNIPCPAFNDYRMVVDGLYLTGDILSAKGYPEAYTDFTNKALKSFAHYVNAATISDMVTLATAVDLTAAGVLPNPSASTEVLGALELQIIDMRYRERMGLNQMVECKAPAWLKGVIRSDMAKRAALVDPANISDAQIETFFTLRGATVQWVYDWQDAFSGVTNGFGSTTPPTAWPTTVSVLLYPQGGYVRAQSDVIDLQAVYDSVLLKTNQYVALFMEQARLVLKRVWDTRIVKIPIPVTGATGAAYDYTPAAKQPTV